MKNIKKKIYLAILSIGLLLPVMMLPSSVSAVDIFQQPQQPCASGSSASSSTVCQDATSQQSGNPVINVTKIVINLLSILVGVVAVISLIIAGVKFTLSQGDPAGITNARDTIIYSIVGLVVVALAQAIVVFVLSRL
jgi:hypothetical protein